MALDQRKAETRAKIMLGGLVVKAGLADMDPATLLGALIQVAAARQAAPAGAEIERLRDIGMSAMKRGTGDGRAAETPEVADRDGPRVDRERTVGATD